MDSELPSIPVFPADSKATFSAWAVNVSVNRKMTEYFGDPPTALPPPWIGV